MKIYANTYQRTNAKYFALETVLRLYKLERITLVDAVKLFRGLARGMGIKEARDILVKL